MQHHQLMIYTWYEIIHKAFQSQNTCIPGRHSWVHNFIWNTICLQYIYRPYMTDVSTAQLHWHLWNMRDTNDLQFNFAKLVMQKYKWWRNYKRDIQLPASQGGLQQL